MKINFLIFHHTPLPALTLAIILLSGACDIIEEPYLREGGQIIDTTGCPVPEFGSYGTPVTKVLLEDYTGHLCVNCPAAAIVAHDIREDYKPRVVLMAVHAGFFANAFGGAYATNYKTAAGDEFDNFFGISTVGNPNGMINRSGYDQNHIVGPGNWKSRVEQELQKQPQMVVQLITEYDSTDRKLCTHIKTSFLSNLSRNLNLAVFITEDSIMSPQKNNDPLVGPVPDIIDYIHMHMLRDAINGTWGKALTSSDSTASGGSSIIRTYAYTVNAAWKAKNCAVIAFVYDTDTKEILQVEEAELTE